MEITINTKQVIAAVWTMIGIVISLIVVLGMNFWPWGNVPWWFSVLAFFGVFLLVALPVYLLIALWAIATRPESE